MTDKKRKGNLRERREELSRLNREYRRDQVTITAMLQLMKYNKAEWEREGIIPKIRQGVILAC